MGGVGRWSKGSSPRSPSRSGSAGSTRPIRSTYKVYEPDRLVLGKRMEDHLRIGVCLWHSFNWPGSDVFGVGTFDRPWLAARRRPDGRRPGKARRRVRVPREARRPVLLLPRSRRRPGGRAPSPRSTANLDAIVDEAEAAHGADRRCSSCGAPPTCSATRATRPARRPTPIPRSSPTPRPRSRSMLEVTQRLGGANYVLWGGREGYETLLNTDLAREEAQLARFLAHGRRAQAQDRLQGHAPDRAEAAWSRPSTSTTTTARRSTASSSATASRASTSSTSRPTTRRWPATASTTRSPTRSPAASSAASTRTAATTRTAGTPTSSRTRSTSCRWRCTRSCGRAGSRPAASTSTPSSAARAWTGPTCSTPTSAASTRSPGRSWSRPT